MIVLGIDPGLARMGFAVLEGTRSGVRRHEFGCFTTLRSGTQAERLTELHRALERMIRTVRPDRIAVEKLYFQKNVRTALVVGEARGTVFLAAGRAGVPVSEFSPQEVKLAVTGYGNAEKGQIQRMTVRLLGLRTVPRPDDAADAIAIAYTCLMSAPL